MEDITILNNGIDMIKLFSDKEGFKEQGKHFNDKNKNSSINNFTSINTKLMNNNNNNNNNNNTILNNIMNDKNLNSKLSYINEIQNLTNTPIQYETNRLELTNYSDMLL